MVNLTVVNRGLIQSFNFRYIIFICFLCVNISCSSNRISKNSPTLLYKIDFQHGFDGDTLSMALNNLEIFKYKVLQTNRVSGNTGVQISLLKIKDHLDINYENEKLYYKIHDSEKMVVTLKINRVVSEINLMKLNKRYIGISKTDMDSAFIIQSSMPFVYD